MIFLNGKDVNLGATFKFVGKDSLKYEAENGVFNKTVLESTHEGFSGKGYANLDNEVGSSVTLSVVTAGEGDKDVKIVFANGSTANRPVSVAVNGKVQVESVDFESTGAWESWDSSVVTLKLPAGASTITIASLTKDGGPNIDMFAFDMANVYRTGCKAVREKQHGPVSIASKKITAKPRSNGITVNALGQKVQNVRNQSDLRNLPKGNYFRY